MGGVLCQKSETIEEPEQTMTDTTPITLWALPPSANSSVIRSFLKVHGIEFTETNAWGQTRTPEYIAKFPTNLAPAIEHGDVYVVENGAILRYLARAFPDKAGAAYPDDIKTQIKIDMLLDYVGTGILSHLPKSCYAALGFPGYPGDVMSMDETKEHADKAAAENATAMLETLENKFVGIFLKDTKFLLSDTPTIADFRFAPMLNFLKIAVKLPDRLKEYDEAMNALPGYTEACAGVVEYASPKWKSD